MKPLYLDRNIKRIEWDIAALKIIRKHQAPSWIALHKISHIIQLSKIDWQGEALYRCMQHGIAIHFIEKGQNLGLCTGKHPIKPHLRGLIVSLIEQNIDIVNNWYQSKHQKMLNRLRKRFQLPRSHQAEQIQQALQEKICLNHHYYQWEKNIKLLNGLLGHQIYLILSYYGFSISLLQQDQLYQQFVKQLRQLLLWEYWQKAALGYLPKTASKKHCVAYFHQHQAMIEKQIRWHINDLWHTITEQ